MGIPLYARNDRVDVFRFADDRLSDKVEYGFHAMAINEMRRDFPVTKWQEREQIEQVWMIGAHADVGGGYLGEESCLSNLGLSLARCCINYQAFASAFPKHHATRCRKNGSPMLSIFASTLL